MSPNKPPRPSGKTPRKEPAQGRPSGRSGQGDAGRPRPGRSASGGASGHSAPSASRTASSPLLARTGGLFPVAGEDAMRLLASYENVLTDAHPLKSRHLRELPYAVRDLSEALTSERGDLQPGYLSEARNLGAYLYYFLPWNLVRLVRLLIGLSLDLPDGSVVVDLGAGPLTFVQALWIARPDLRGRALRFVCQDTSPSAMRAGQQLFERLVRETNPDGSVPWTLTLVHAPLVKRTREKADLLVAANVLNELAWAGSETLSEAAEELAEDLADRLTPTGRVLVVEPGTRRSGRIMARLHQGLIDAGLTILAPCTHASACVMLERRGSSWCHFNFSVQSAPDWLKGLSQAARLQKRELSMSFLYASREEPAAGKGEEDIRVISETFPLPGYGAKAGLPGREFSGTYGCSQDGLVLLVADQLAGPRLRPGETIRVRNKPASLSRDPKTGALEIPVYGK